MFDGARDSRLTATLDCGVAEPFHHPAIHPMPHVGLASLVYFTTPLLCCYLRRNDLNSQTISEGTVIN